MHGILERAMNSRSVKKIRDLVAGKFVLKKHNQHYAVLINFIVSSLVECYIKVKCSNSFSLL